MGIVENLTEWFKLHPAVKRFTKALILGFIGVFCTAALASIGALDGTNFAWSIPVLTATLMGLDKWVRTNPTLPIVGAKPK